MTVLAEPFDGAFDDSLWREGVRIPHLRLVIALESTGQISAAAAALNTSQPSASRMLAEIEAILAAPLCERQPRGVVLTPYGRAFAARARTILRELREASREIRDLRSGTAGSVSVGAVTAPAAQLIIPAISAVRAAHPRIQVNLNVETSTELTRELLASRLDFMLARIPDDADPRLFEAREIGVERACLVVRRGHPLLRQSKVSLADLCDRDWVMQPPGSLLNRTIERLFLTASLPLPDRIVSTSSLLITMLIVQRSDSVAPIALDVAEPFFSAGSDTLAPLPLDLEITVQPYSLITLRGRQLPPAAKTLFDAVVAEIERR